MRCAGTEGRLKREAAPNLHSLLHTLVINTNPSSERHAAPKVKRYLRNELALHSADGFGLRRKTLYLFCLEVPTAAEQALIAHQKGNKTTLRGALPIQ